MATTYVYKYRREPMELRVEELPLTVHTEDFHEIFAFVERALWNQLVPRTLKESQR